MNSRFDYLKLVDNICFHLLKEMSYCQTFCFFAMQITDYCLSVEKSQHYNLPILLESVVNHFYSHMTNEMHWDTNQHHMIQLRLTEIRINDKSIQKHTKSNQNRKENERRTLFPNLSGEIFERSTGV